MKIIMVLFWTLLFTDCFAKTEAEKRAAKIEARNAKTICLMRDDFMRGERLKACIKTEIDKSKRSTIKKRK